MKNRINKFLIALLTLSLFVFSCSHEIDKIEDEKDDFQLGNTTVKMFVPDYHTLADQTSSRAIAPQTKYVRLSAYNNVSFEWNIFQTLSLDSAQKTPVENAPNGFSGSVFTFNFTKVYSKYYEKDSLKVDLLDGSYKVITSGTNATAVTVNAGTSATTSFYTIPTQVYGEEFGLIKGEMKFIRVNLNKNTHYTLHIDVSGGVYPDVVTFNQDGTLNEYFVVDSVEDSRIEFTENEDKLLYIGLWADDEEQISKCNVKLYRDFQDFSFSDSSIGFWAGENYQINLTPIPSDAYLETPTYASDNEDIKVSEKGVITSDKECEGTVTVTCGQISHTIKVNVYEKATELTGVLSGEKLTWTKENSPYKVTGNVLIEEGTELVIDPGVEVYFTGDYYIKMNGTINARGTKEEPIIITRAASFTGKWSGLKIGGGSLSLLNKYTYNSGNILQYVNFSHASIPLDLSNPIFVDHCNFIDCSDSVTINNGCGGSSFINNKFESGIYIGSNSSQVNLINNIINSRLYFYGYSENSTIESNTIDVYSFYIRGSTTFNNNDIYVSSISVGDTNSYAQTFTNNNFNNYTGSLLDMSGSSHDSLKSIDFTNNYWGQSQTEELIANELTGEKNVSFIYDYRDDFNLTEIDYTGWLKSPNENAGYKGDGFIAFDYTVNGYDFNESGYYPETQEAELTIGITPTYHKNEISEIRIAQGYENMLETPWQPYTGSFAFVVDKESLVDGYAPICVQIKDTEGNLSSVVTHNITYGSPTITTNLVDGTVYKNPTTNLGYQFDFNDDCSIYGFELYLDDVVIESDSWTNGGGTKFSIGTEGFEVTYSYNKIGLLYMSSGEYTLTAKVWDKANNITTKEITFTIERTNTSTYEGITYDKTTGEFLKDDKTVYLWHLNDSGAEVNNANVTISGYTNTLGGLGEGCASYISASDTIPLDVSNNAFTLEYWIKGSDKYAKPYLGVGKGNSFNIYLGEVCFTYEATDSLVYRTFYYQQIPNDGQWHYSTLVYCKDYVARYIDGMLVDYDDKIDIKICNSDSELYISSSSLDAVDEIRISNEARSADEIAEYYKAVKEIIE